jgi:hypothetical protein
MLMRLVKVVAGCASLVLTGCATAPPAPPAEPTPISVSGGARSAQPAPRGGSSDVGGAAGVAGLCDALRDADDVEYAGNEVQRARAREAQDRRRADAAEGTYAVQVPGTGFAFRGYDLEGRQLELDTARSLTLADGVELVATNRDRPLAVELNPDAAEKLLKEHAGGRVGLKVIFRPARSELRKDACLRLSGGAIVKLPVEVLAFALIGPGGTPLARGQMPDYVDESPVASPEVSVGKPRSSEGREVSEAVTTATRSLGPALLPCYQKALQARPNLRGTLVLELRVTSDGRVESPRMQMSSLGDEALVACAVQRAARTKLAGGAAGHLSLPVTFHSKDDQ